MNARGSFPVKGLKPLVRVRASVLVVERFPPLPDLLGGRRWQLEVGNRGPQIEAGAPHDDRCPPTRENIVDRLVRETLELANRHVVLHVEDADEPRGLL